MKIKGYSKNINLHDCYIKTIKLSKEHIVLEFDEDGFYAFDSNKNNYFRTKKAYIKLYGKYDDVFYFYGIRRKTKTKQYDTYVAKEFDLKELINRLDNKSNLVVIDEFYVSNSFMFCCELSNLRYKYLLYFTLPFSEIEYNYSEIDYNKQF